ncbi:MAG TPA: rhodanese-like domain-containing protein [Ignavibacteriaceae bacterium]|nr:rhodanese-like domain-containing protein [Ignavibacteriaceae bacterium]
MKKELIKYSCIALLISASSCLNEHSNSVLSFNSENSAELLIYLEKNGDYINSGLAPSLINADEVFSGLNNYLILDLRSRNEYENGHIQGAVNISHNELSRYFFNNDLSRYSKIVMVSQTGQAAAYYCCLVRLLGFNKVYSLNFGMASWNINFARIWQENAMDSYFVNSFNDQYYSKGNFTALPSLRFSDTSTTDEKKLKERVDKLFQEGFRDNPEDTTNAYNASIPVSDLFSETDPSLNFYLICYGTESLYYSSSGAAGDPLAGFGHPPGAILYVPNEDLKTTNYLQTLPATKTLVLYSGSGQLSACASAYLRLLGYEAKSLLFGGNALIYSRMIWHSSLNDDAFSLSKVMNYPYSTGN